MTFQGTTIRKAWFKPPLTNEEYEKMKYTIPNFSKEELQINKEKVDLLKQKLVSQIKKEKIDADLLLYGSQLYYPSPKKDVDILAIYGNVRDAKRLIKLLGGKTEPVLSSDVLTQPFTRFTFHSRWNNAQMSVGLLSRKCLEKTLELKFEVPLTAIRVKKPSTPAIKRQGLFDGRIIWAPLKIKSAIINGKKYWLRLHNSWVLLPETLAPASLPIYVEQMLIGEVLYSPDRRRLDTNLSRVMHLATDALGEFNSKHGGGCIENAFVRNRLFPDWFRKRLLKKLRNLSNGKYI